MRNHRRPSLWLRLVAVVLVAAFTGTIIPDSAFIPSAKADCSIPVNTSTESMRVTEFKYDADGRLVQVNSPEGVINYSYDSATGRHTSTCTTNSETLYGYDELGRLKTVTMDKRNGTAISETSTYTYTAIGARQELDLPNGGTTTYAYDSLNRLTNLTQKASGNVLLAKYDYTVYATGRRSGATEVLLQADDNTYATNTIGWQYDGMYRLTNETYGTTLSGISFATAYSYDKVGNRLSELVTKPTSTNTVTCGYNPNDQLTNEVSTVNGATKYLYDANGTLTSKTNATANTGYTFNYDLRNRLQGATMTGVSGGPITTSYLYNDQGIRVRSIANGTTKYFLNDANNPSGYSQVLEELSAANGIPSMSYVLGDDMLAQSPTSGTASYLLYDGHGSTRQLSQTGNVVVEQYNYDGYGQSLGTQPTYASPAATTMLYAGQQFDTALQQYYMRARYYDASNGRFNQMDPFAGNNDDPQSLHKYQYVWDDPVNRIDPSGHDGDLTTMQVVTAISVSINVYSAAVDLQAKRYSAATVDLFSAGLGAFGLFGGPPPGMFGALATAGGTTIRLAEMWPQIVAGAQEVSQIAAAGDVIMMAASGSGSSSSGDKLDWSFVDSEGETRADHVMKHAVDDVDKPLHGVFNGNPIDIVNDAWSIKNVQNIKPIDSQGWADVYLIPRASSGWEGGYRGSKNTCDFVTLVMKKGTKMLVTGYPVGKP
jgi:RHS repeat-associated protein